MLRMPNIRIVMKAKGTIVLCSQGFGEIAQLVSIGGTLIAIPYTAKIRIKINDNTLNPVIKISFHWAGLII